MVTRQRYSAQRSRLALIVVLLVLAARAEASPPQVRDTEGSRGTKEMKHAPSTPKARDVPPCPLEFIPGIGGGGVWASGPGVGWNVGLDLTIGQMIPTPRGWSGGAWWVSAGAGLSRLEEHLAAQPYVEAGYLWWLVNLGGGASLRAQPGSVQGGPHLFVGLPVIPLGLGVLEPYYRPAFLFGADRTIVHEFGVYLKLWVFTVGQYWD